MNSGYQALALSVAAVVGICVTLFVYAPQITSCLKRIAKAQEKAPARLLVKTFVVDVAGDATEEAFETLDEDLNTFSSTGPSPMQVHSVRDSVFNIHGYGQIARTVTYSYRQSG